MGFNSVISVSIPRAEFPWRVAYENLKSEYMAADLAEMIRVVHIVD